MPPINALTSMGCPVCQTSVVFCPLPAIRGPVARGKVPRPKSQNQQESIVGVSGSVRVGFLKPVSDYGRLLRRHTGMPSRTTFS